MTSNINHTNEQLPCTENHSELKEVLKPCGKLPPTNDIQLDRSYFKRKVPMIFVGIHCDKHVKTSLEKLRPFFCPFIRLPKISKTYRDSNGSLRKLMLVQMPEPDKILQFITDLNQWNVDLPKDYANLQPVDLSVPKLPECLNDLKAEDSLNDEAFKKVSVVEEEINMLENIVTSPCLVNMSIGYENFTFEQVIKELLPDFILPITGFTIIGHVIQFNLKTEALPYRHIIGKLRSECRGMGDLNLLKPYAVFEQLFEQKIRIEDRDCLEFADINVAAGVLTSCHGSALVKVGKTQVIAGVKVKVIPESGNSGNITCNVEFAGLCHRGSRLNAPQPKYAQWLSSTIQRLLNNFAFPSIENQLNIFSINDPDTLTPVASYTLKLDVFILHDDGCLLDACVPAALVSLCTTKWTKLYAVTDEQAAGSYLELYKPGPRNETKSLKMNEWPVSLSFCFVPRPVADRKSKTVPIIAQPTKRELDIWDTDAGPVHITVSQGAVVDLSVVSAFLTGLWDSLFVTSANESDVVNSWEVLFDSAVSHAQKVLQIIQKAVN